MKRENARVLIETRLQELLLESITCWEQYRSIAKKKPILLPLYLDRFILILQNIKHVLKDLREEEKISIP